MGTTFTTSPRAAFAAAALIGLGHGNTVAAEVFYMGGDVSLLPFIESRGGSFRDNGLVTPADHIMVDRGANLFRLRLFVNPNTNYSATSGAIQDLSYDIALAQRLKASGAKLLLDFHYSDTWADPGHQAKPAAWMGQDFATLNATVRDYTKNSLLAFKNAGVMPDMVQVGNEITNGMIYTDGQIVYSGSGQNQSWMNFGSLLHSAIHGVREVDALSPGQHTNIAIHIDGGDVQGRAQYYFTNLTNISGVSDYDTMAMSFYPASTTAFSYLQGNLNWMVAGSSKKIMIAETNYPWKGTATGASWPSTSTGQHDFLVAVRDLVRNLPNNRGEGVLWWYPEAIKVPNTSIWKGGAIALFDDSGGDALPALSEFQLAAPTWNVDSDGTWSNAANWSNGLPDGAGQTARFGSVINAPRTVTLDSARSVGTMTFLSSSSYAIVGNSTLTLDVNSGPANISVLAGSHTISCPVALADDTDINVAWTNSLTLSGHLTATGKKITKLGSGTVQLENVRASALDVQYGKVKLSVKSTPDDPAGTTVVSGLSIAAAGASMDLTNNAMVIDYSGSAGTLVDDVRQHLLNGRLISSSAGTVHRVGYADNAVLGLSSFAGHSVDPTSLLIGYTSAGDANLDGLVDIKDLFALASHYNTSGNVWTGGDFNYDGTVDAVDLGLLARNWQAGVGAPPGIPLDAAMASLGLPGVAVPEPAGLRLLPACGWLLARRRHKTRRASLRAIGSSTTSGHDDL
jgi:arabinogalactan endo-1,4-beta-galactosidase